MSSRDLAPIGIRLEGIGHVLRDYRLAVPPYQRAYSWETDQVSEFWWDLRAAFRSKAAQYFLGTLVLTDDDGRTAVIDGQQRLATTSLLFAALRNTFLQRGDANRADIIQRDYVTASDLRTARLEPRLRLNPEDRANFRAAIFSTYGEDEDSDDLDPTSRIGRALSFFETHFEREAKEAGPHWDETLFQWVDFLEKRARVITVHVANEADAFLIFETLNDRGRELTVADLLKNYLFGVARDSMDEIQANWDRALEALGASADEEVFTTFVRHFWGSMYGATRERELYGRIKAAVPSTPLALKFVADLAESAPLYAALLDAENPYWDERPAAKTALETLLRLGLEQYRPLLLAAMRRFRDGELEALLRALISWSVRGLVVGGIGGGTTERAYGEAAAAVTDGDAGTAQEVFGELANVIPGDEVFTQVFETRRINRTNVAKYLLTALARHESGVGDALIVSDVTDSQFALVSNLPRNGDAASWPRFPADEIGQWALRLGNMAVRHRQSSERRPEADALLKKPWSPNRVSARQVALAKSANEIWPRRP